jgi:hypothetical protein
MKCVDCLNCEPCCPGIFTCSHYAEQTINPDMSFEELCDAFIPKIN